MQPKEKLVSDWLEKAAHDSGAAKTLFRYAPDLEDAIAFHCQQEVEKALKAYLVWLDVLPPKTHDLVKLAELLANSGKDLPDFGDDLHELTLYAVAGRYPNQCLTDPLPIPHLLSAAQRVTQYVYQELKNAGYASKPYNN